jgi:hypothetical protein
MNMTELETKATGQNETAVQDQDNRAERISVIDYKMVTFSLAGKDYAIDICSQGNRQGRPVYVRAEYLPVLLGYTISVVISFRI